MTAAHLFQRFERAATVSSIDPRRASLSFFSASRAASSALTCSSVSSHHRRRRGPRHRSTTSVCSSVVRFSAASFASAVLQLVRYDRVLRTELLVSEPRPWRRRSRFSRCASRLGLHFLRRLVDGLRELIDLLAGHASRRTLFTPMAAAARTAISPDRPGQQREQLGPDRGAHRADPGRGPGEYAAKQRDVRAEFAAFRRSPRRPARAPPRSRPPRPGAGSSGSPACRSS